MNIDWILLFIFFFYCFWFCRALNMNFSHTINTRKTSHREYRFFPPIVHFFNAFNFAACSIRIFSRIIKIDFFPFLFSFSSIVFDLAPHSRIWKQFFTRYHNHRSIFFLSFILFHNLDSAFEYKFFFWKKFSRRKKNDNTSPFVKLIHIFNIPYNA